MDIQNTSPEKIIW